MFDWLVFIHRWPAQPTVSQTQNRILNSASRSALLPLPALFFDKKSYHANKARMDKTTPQTHTFTSCAFHYLFMPIVVGKRINQYSKCVNAPNDYEHSKKSAGITFFAFSRTVLRLFVLQSKLPFFIRTIQCVGKGTLHRPYTSHSLVLSPSFWSKGEGFFLFTRWVCQKRKCVLFYILAVFHHNDNNRTIYLILAMV